MALVTLSEVRDALPTVAITPTTQPNEHQVERYAADTEGDLRAAMKATGAGWPDADTDAAVWLAGACLDGVIWRIMRAKFALAGPEGATQIDTAYTTWQGRLTEIRRSGLRVGQSSGTPAAAVYDGPVYVNPTEAPGRYGSFAEWSERADLADRSRYKGEVFRP